MAEVDLARHIERRLGHYEYAIADDKVARLAAYLQLLARWNRRINLTALPLAPSTDDAIDRLIVEPVIASQLVRPSDRSTLDVGSGGGSPAIPFQIATALPRLVMVEMRERKAAFLREAARILELPAEVFAGTLNDLATKRRADEVFDVMTLRAVELDRAIARDLSYLAGPGGILLWFTTLVINQKQLVGMSLDWRELSLLPLTKETNCVRVMQRESSGGESTIGAV